MNQINTIGQAGLSLIEKFEGFRSAPYLDIVGVPTIGYGSTFYPGGRKVTMQDAAITLEQGTQLLMNTLAHFEIDVATYVTSIINQNQFDALVSFAYNLGSGALQSSTLLRKVNANPADPTIADEFVKWDHAGGQVVEGLLTRRKAESALYFS